MLVLNPEYSSYDEIVNLSPPKELTEEQQELIRKNCRYSNELYEYKLDQQFGGNYKSKPIY
jgi:hypothetical protein